MCTCHPQISINSLPSPPTGPGSRPYRCRSHSLRLGRRGTAGDRGGHVPIRTDGAMDLGCLRLGVMVLIKWTLDLAQVGIPLHPPHSTPSVHRPPPHQPETIIPFDSRQCARLAERYPPHARRQRGISDLAEKGNSPDSRPVIGLWWPGTLYLFPEGGNNGRRPSPSLVAIPPRGWLANPSFCLA